MGLVEISGHRDGSRLSRLVRVHRDDMEDRPFRTGLIREFECGADGRRRGGRPVVRQQDLPQL
jgi:hypothetical protein